MATHAIYNNGLWCVEYHYGPDRGAFRYTATQVKGVYSCNATRMDDGALVWDRVPPLYVQRVAEVTSRNTARRGFVTHKDLVKTFGV